MDLREKMDRINEYRTAIIEAEGEVTKAVYLRDNIDTDSLALRTTDGFLPLNEGEQNRLQHCLESILNDRVADLTGKLDKLLAEAQEII